ncbi:hypothetical protein BD413DRAFT_597992 [Trametes elegans]|nr:hypothetical protein BD413DRAFT_597992 [Trametes elegans]
MAAPQPGDPIVLPRGGRFIGATASAYEKQISADIYLQNIWTTAGLVGRIAVASVGWGVSAALVQNAIAPHPGHPGRWIPDNNDTQAILFVIDLGRDITQAVTQNPNLPNPLPLAPAPGLGGAYVIAGFHGIVAHRIAWHHRVNMRVRMNNNFIRLHYHKHAKRKDHEEAPPPILRKVDGKHFVFDEVTFKTQVQNCRRANPV